MLLFHASLTGIKRNGLSSFNYNYMDRKTLKRYSTTLYDENNGKLGIFTREEVDAKSEGFKTKPNTKKLLESDVELEDVLVEANLSVTSLDVLGSSPILNKAFWTMANLFGIKQTDTWIYAPITIVDVYNSDKLYTILNKLKPDVFEAVEGVKKPVADFINIISKLSTAITSETNLVSIVNSKPDPLKDMLIEELVNIEKTIVSKNTEGKGAKSDIKVDVFPNFDAWFNELPKFPTAISCVASFDTFKNLSYLLPSDGVLNGLKDVSVRNVIDSAPIDEKTSFTDEWKVIYWIYFNLIVTFPQLFIVDEFNGLYDFNLTKAKQIRNTLNEISSENTVIGKYYRSLIVMAKSMSTLSDKFDFGITPQENRVLTILHTFVSWINFEKARFTADENRINLTFKQIRIVEDMYDEMINVIKTEFPLYKIAVMNFDDLPDSLSRTVSRLISNDPNLLRRSKSLSLRAYKLCMYRKITEDVTYLEDEGIPSDLKED